MQKRDEILNNIKKIHNDDNTQMEIIKSECQRLMVEASAGSGKTKVLISTIAYNLATKKLPNTKKILALTFSVNASYKIKKDVIEQLPIIIDGESTENKLVTKNILVSNYHGLCRRILNLYGKKLTNSSFELKDFSIVSDNKIPCEINLTDEEKDIIKRFDNSIAMVDFDEYSKLLKNYNDIILKKLVVEKYLTYNSMISLVLELFDKYSNLKKQYRNLFEFIIVDEYQDTNLLGYSLLKEIIGEDTRLLFFGDSLQRIYGFIGAIPNIMNKTQKEFKMDRIELNINYRFKDNPELLLLDKNVRLNAYDSSLITKISNPIIICANDYDKEYTWIVNKLLENIEKNINTTILVKSVNNNYNTSNLLLKLKNSNIKFFYALFSDDCEEYIKFHVDAYDSFYKIVKDKKVITKKILENYYGNFIKKYIKLNNPVYDSLIILLRKLLDSIYDIYQSYKIEDLILFILDVFSNNGLKQYMNRIDEKIIIATIHSYKGLESDCVIVTDLESNIFPSYFTCKECKNSDSCKQCIIEEKIFLEELSVFYVAITRAKKELYLTYSENQLTKIGTKKCNRSCMLNLIGIGNSNMIKV